MQIHYTFPGGTQQIGDRCCTSSIEIEVWAVTEAHFEPLESIILHVMRSTLCTAVAEI
jgi:hypothetical protein